MGKTKDDDAGKEKVNSAELKRMDKVIENVTVEGGPKLVASVTAELVDMWKTIPKPFAQTNQEGQQDVFRRLEHMSKELVRQVVEQVAASGQQPIRCLMGKLAVADKITGTLTVAVDGDSEEETRALLLLHDCHGKYVMLTKASVEDYAGVEADDPSEPDQNDMPFDAGTDEIPLDDPSLTEPEAEAEEEPA